MPPGISFGAGTLYVSALPTHNPGSDGARRAINTATGEKYRWVSGTTWEVEPGDGGSNSFRDASGNPVDGVTTAIYRTDPVTIGATSGDGQLNISIADYNSSTPKVSFEGDGGVQAKIEKHSGADSPSIADFYINRGFFENVSSAGDNQVVNFGFNVSPGGGVINPNQAAMALAFENNYKNDPGEPSNPGHGFFEWQQEVIYPAQIVDANGVTHSTGVAANTKRRFIAGYFSNEKPSNGGAWATMTDHIVFFDFKTATQKIIWGIADGTPYTKGIYFLDEARINFSQNNTPILVQRNAANNGDVQIIKVDNQDRILIGGSGESSIAAYNFLNVTNTGAIWNENGRIAIGKTGNLSRLEVYSPGSEVMFWGVGGFENIGLRHRLDSSVWNVVGSTGNYFMRLNGTAPNNSFTMNASGQVGWGTLSPGARQHTVATTGATTAMERWENTTGASTLYRSNATPEGAITASPGDITLTNESGTGKAYIKRTGTGNTGHSELQQKADAYVPLQKTDAAAANGELYYSTTQNKLCYKDPGGTVNPLY